MASQTWTQGAFGLGESFPTLSNDDLNPFARGVFSRINPNLINSTLQNFGVSVAIGLTGGAACYCLCPEAVGAGALTGEAGTYGIESTNALNQAIGASQRKLLTQIFETGDSPEGLSQRTLQIYKDIAQRAIAAGKDNVGVQAVRLKIIDEALKVLSK